MSRPNPSRTWLRSHCYLQVYHLHNTHVCTYMYTCTALHTINVAFLCTLLTAAVNIFLELQERHCSDQLTLICRHSIVPIDPSWTHFGTVKGGHPLSTVFPGAMYTVRSNKEHSATISGVANEQTFIQCAYNVPRWQPLHFESGAFPNRHHYRDVWYGHWAFTQTLPHLVDRHKSSK